MNVFLVDAGKLFSLDASIVSKRVCDLQSNLSDLADIPIDKQVLLTFDGRSLDTTSQLYNYGTSFAIDKPLFLFSKSSIECNIVPPNNTLPQDPNLQERLDKYLSETQSCETLKCGADLASDYQKYAESILTRTKQLVEDQQFQRDGWAAVIKNLDQVTTGFNKRVVTFKELYNGFLTNKDNYNSMLLQFETDVKLLSQIPLTKGITQQLQDNKLIESIMCSKQQGLGITESMRAPDPMGISPGMEQDQQMLKLYTKENDFISLLDWIEAQDSQNSLNSLVLQCSRAMEQVNQVFLPRVLEEVDKVTQSLQAPGMRDIKGLEERLAQLSSILQHMIKICEEQATNTNTIRSQQESFMAQGDISVLTDLLDAHKDQLKLLHSNNRTLIEYYNKFAIAKGELSQNLLIRLNWVTHCQKTIWNCDGRLTMLAENLTRVKRRFMILKQINIAPQLYCRCLGEVYRRGLFTKKFKSWGENLISKVDKETDNEGEKREQFQDIVQGHFLTTLFRGLDSIPPKFASKDALNFDTDLFDVTDAELLSLAELFPDFSESLIPKTSLEDEVSELYKTEHMDCKDVATSNSQATEDVTTENLTKTVDITINAEYNEQLDKNIKLELEMNRIQHCNSELDDMIKELEEKLSVADTNLNLETKKVSKLTKDMEDLDRECKSYKSLACEKDTKYNNLKMDFDAHKLELRGMMMEKAKLNTQIDEQQTRIQSHTKLVNEREEQIKKLKRDLEVLTSDTSVAEQHLLQLNNLRLEIEREKDKERENAIELLTLEKDKTIADLERAAKLAHGEAEKLRQDQIQELSDENSKLQARIAALQAELRLEQETSHMYKQEAERDLKVQKQNATAELNDIQQSTSQREGQLLEKIKGLQEEITSLKNASLSAAASTAENETPAPTSHRNLAELQAELRRKDEEISRLQSATNRSLSIAVTQFQKGDTVFFYYDETRDNYLVANVSPNEYQYFLHPENLAALGLSLENPRQKPWCIGVIKEKEFCQARKQNNRFKVPEGSKFYRVYARSRTGTARSSAGPSTANNT